MQVSGGRRPAAAAQSRRSAADSDAGWRPLARVPGMHVWTDTRLSLPVFVPAPPSRCAWQPLALRTVRGQFQGVASTCTHDMTSHPARRPAALEEEEEEEEEEEDDCNQLDISRCFEARTTLSRAAPAQKRPGD